jgi:hypothetical protein
MNIQKGPYQPWFGFLFTFIFLVGALTLGFDIATDYQGSFGASESSWYYLTWELAEIAGFSTLAGWFMYRTSNNSAVLGWSIFAALVHIRRCGIDIISWLDLPGVGCHRITLQARRSVRHHDTAYPLRFGLENGIPP